MQTIEVKSWDDVEAKADRRVPADVQVTIEYATPKGTVRRVLDLTAEHGEDLDKALAPWLEAGRDPAAPVTTRSHKAGSKEARGFYAGLRAWAVEVGRGEEHWTSGNGDHPRQLYYPKGLVADYEKYLMEQAERQSTR